MPRNAIALALAAPSYDGIAIFRAGASEPVEVDETTTELWDGSTLVTLTPRDLLEPDTDYEIVRLRGTETTVMSQFTVGTDIDDEPPSALTLADLRAETWSEDSFLGSSCVHRRDGYFGQLHLDLAAPPGGVHHTLVRVGPPGGPSETFFIPWPLDEARIFLRNEHCSPGLVAVVPGNQYCATVVGYDLAGNHTSNAELCTTAVECARLTNPPDLAPYECEPAAPEPQPTVAEAGGCAASGRGTRPSLWLATALSLATTAIARRRRRWQTRASRRTPAP